jgi:hypothetical protein
MMDIPEFIAKIIDLRCQFLFTVTLWFRTEEYKATTPNTCLAQHSLGLAVDVVLHSDFDVDEFEDACTAAELSTVRSAMSLHVQAPR